MTPHHPPLARRTRRPYLVWRINIYNSLCPQGGADGSAASKSSARCQHAPKNADKLAAESASMDSLTREVMTSVDAGVSTVGERRYAFFITEKQCSMGWNSGVYGGKNHGVSPLPMMVSITLVVLWIDALSINSTSLSSVFRVDIKSAKMSP